MKKIIFTIIISILTTFPLLSMAALDFNLDDLLNSTTTTPNITINKFDIVWSADTYTPFGYEGRNLPTIGSEVKVDAMINASGGSVKSLKYSWFLEDIFQQNQSGYGKDSFSFYIQQMPGRYQTVRVQAFNDDRSVFQEKTIQVPVTNPELIVYSSNGNSHFSNQSSGNSLNIFSEKISLIVKPYFFSIKKLTDLIFEWTLAGQQPIISSNYDASILNLTANNASGTSNNLYINVTNPGEERQNISRSINLNIQ
jgi:hypothetical protein